MNQAAERTGWGHAAVLAMLALVAAAFAAWQTGPWPAPRFAADRWPWAAGLALAWVALVGAIWHRHRREAPAPPADDALWVVHASQTGMAEAYAARTAASLAQAGLAVQVFPISSLDLPRLQAARRVLFVASTTGEGDAPDVAGAFLRHAMAGRCDLSALQYGLLALGDREYVDFCGFGRQLDHWLQQQGARPWFDRVEVDNGDAGALRHWQQQLRQWVGGGDCPDWEPPAYAGWRLQRRECLNPGSQGGACFHIELAPPPGTALDWQAGDIAEIGPRLAPGEGPPPFPHREYSVASLPADGALHLLVRRMQRPDGTVGLASGWLTERAPLGATIELRIRRNAGFHPPDDDRPLLLVGNGTGLAGLRALLKARQARGHHRNWLLFGERESAVDAFHGAELEAWASQGVIEVLDRVWSRDAGGARYVQDRLREQADRLRAWVRDGAAIYVCGSLDGMAPGVHAALQDVLGSDRVDALADAGRYRRDVY